MECESVVELRLHSNVCACARECLIRLSPPFFSLYHISNCHDRISFNFSSSSLLVLSSHTCLEMPPSMLHTHTCTHAQHTTACHAFVQNVQLHMSNCNTLVVLMSFRGFFLFRFDFRTKTLLLLLARYTRLKRLHCSVFVIHVSNQTNTHAHTERKSW